MGSSLWDTLPLDLQRKVLFERRRLELAELLEETPGVGGGERCCCGIHQLTNPYLALYSPNGNLILVEKNRVTDKVLVKNFQTGWNTEWSVDEDHGKRVFGWTARHPLHGTRFSYRHPTGLLEAPPGYS